MAGEHPAAVLGHQQHDAERGPAGQPQFAGADKDYTLLSPGTDGGLRTDAYQPPPSPAFGSGTSGGALAWRSSTGAVLRRELQRGDGSDRSSAGHARSAAGDHCAGRHAHRADHGVGCTVERPVVQPGHAEARRDAAHSPRRACRGPTTPPRARSPSIGRAGSSAARSRIHRPLASVGPARARPLTGRAGGWADFGEVAAGIRPPSACGLGGSVCAAGPARMLLAGLGPQPVEAFGTQPAGIDPGPTYRAACGACSSQVSYTLMNASIAPSTPAASPVASRSSSSPRVTA